MNSTRKLKKNNKKTNKKRVKKVMSGSNILQNILPIKKKSIEIGDIVTIKDEFNKDNCFYIVTGVFYRTKFNNAKFNEWKMRIWDTKVAYLICITPNRFYNFYNLEKDKYNKFEEYAKNMYTVETGQDMHGEPIYSFYPNVGKYLQEILERAPKKRKIPVKPLDNLVTTTYQNYTIGNVGDKIEIYPYSTFYKNFTYGELSNVDHAKNQYKLKDYRNVIQKKDFYVTELCEKSLKDIQKVTEIKDDNKIDIVIEDIFKEDIKILNEMFEENKKETEKNKNETKTKTTEQNNHS